MKKLNQNTFPKNHFSLIFQTLEKHQIDCKLQSPKLDCCKNTREQENISSKILVKNLSQMRYIKPLFKTSRWQQIRPVLTFRSTGRSTGQQSNFDRLLLPVDRPVDRALNQRAMALWPVDRPIDRSNPRVGCFQSVDRSVDRLNGQASVHCARRSTGRVDRLWVRSTARAWQAILWDRKLRFLMS